MCPHDRGDDRAVRGLGAGEALGAVCRVQRGAHELDGLEIAQGDAHGSRLADESEHDIKRRIICTGQ